MEYVFCFVFTFYNGFYSILRAAPVRVEGQRSREPWLICLYLSAKAHFISAKTNWVPPMCPGYKYDYLEDHRIL